VGELRCTWHFQLSPANGPQVVKYQGAYQELSYSRLSPDAILGSVEAAREGEPDAGRLQELGVRKWYIPPPPGVFRKDINPWELLTNFS